MSAKNNRNIQQAAKAGLKATSFVLTLDYKKDNIISIPDEFSEFLAAKLTELHYPSSDLGILRLVIHPIPCFILDTLWNRCIDSNHLNIGPDSFRHEVEQFVSKQGSSFPFSTDVMDGFETLLKGYNIIVNTSRCADHLIRLCQATTLSFRVRSGAVYLTDEANQLHCVSTNDGQWRFLTAKHDFKCEGRSYVATWTAARAKWMPVTLYPRAPNGRFFTMNLKPIWPHDEKMTFLQNVQQKTELLPKDHAVLDQLLATARTKQNYTALHLAAKGFHLETLRRLLVSGKGDALINAEGNNGMTPLMLAVRHLNAGGVKNTSCPKAVCQRKLDTIKLLLQHGANPCLATYNEPYQIESWWLSKTRLLPISALGIAVKKIQKLCLDMRIHCKSQGIMETHAVLHDVLELLIAFAPGGVPIFCAEPKKPHQNPTWEDGKRRWCRVAKIMTGYDGKGKAKHRTSHKENSQCSVWHWLIRRAFALDGDDELFLMDPPTFYFPNCFSDKHLCAHVDLARCDNRSNLPPYIFPSSLLHATKDDNPTAASAADLIHRGGLPLFEYLLLLPSCGKQTFMDALRDVLWSGGHQHRLKNYDKESKLYFPPDLTFSFLNGFHDEKNMPNVEPPDGQTAEEDQPEQERLDRKWVWNFPSHGGPKTKRLIPIASRLGVITMEHARVDRDRNMGCCMLFILQRPGALTDFIV